MSQPDELTVRRCNIRLVRRAEDGALWLDREDHLRLARKLKPMLLAMLDDVVAPQLEELGSIDVEGLALNIKVPAALLEKPASLLAKRLREESQVATAKALKTAGLSKAQRTDHYPAPPRSAPSNSATARTRADSSVIASLRRRADSGELAKFVRNLTADALAKLFSEVLAELQSVISQDRAVHGSSERSDERLVPSPTDWPAQAERLIAETLATLPENSAQMAQSTAEKLAELAGLIAALKSQIEATAMGAAQTEQPSAETELETERALKHKREINEKTERGVSEEKADKPAGRPVRESDDDQSESSLKDPALESLEGRYFVDCALPFLAIARLMRHGIFDLVTSMDAVRVLTFAIGLKTQSEPAVSNVWSPEALLSARLAAGLSGPLEGAQLAQGSRKHQLQFDAAMAALNTAMAPAWLDLSAIAAVRDGNNFMLFDPVGQYPAGGIDGDRLEDALGKRSAVLVLPPGDVEGIARLSKAGWTAFCQGLPSAGDDLMSLVGPRGWRGVSSVSEDRLAALPASWPRLSQAAFRAEALWEAFTIGRPLTAGAASRDASDLERSSAAIAAFGLADIAYELSRRDETAWSDPDPLLTVERFGDLQARIDIDANEIMVTLPLGRRFSDLFEAGLLDTEHRLNWWGGRKLRIGGG